jgi:hypothetical protein
MSRKLAICLVATASSFVPSVALAAVDPEHATVGWVVGAATLVATAVLLVLGLGLSRVATGSATAENISFVVVACMCLAASVLAGWGEQFATDLFVVGQLELGAQLLIIATIVFLCVYFYRVRSALKSFLTATSSTDVLAQMHLSDATTTEPDDSAGGVNG